MEREVREYDTQNMMLHGDIWDENMETICTQLLTHNILEGGTTERIEAEEHTKGITLFDTCKGFNNLSLLSIIWKARHHCMVGLTFFLKYYQQKPQLFVL